MLFSTLAYAQFFIATFVVYWLLVEKRFAGLLSGLLSLCLALSTCLPSGLLTGALSPNNSATPYWLRGILVFLAISQCSWQWKSYQAEARRAQGATLPSSQLALNIGLSTIIAGAIAYYDTSIVEALLAQLKILPESGFGGLQPPEVLPPGTTPPNHTESPASLSSGLIWLLRFSTLAIGGALLFLVLKTKRRSLLFLLLASYFFYASYSYLHLPLIFLSSTADWWLARQIARSETARKRQQLLFGTVVLNLGVLGYFKYYNLAHDTTTGLIHHLGGIHLSSLSDSWGIAKSAINPLIGAINHFFQWCASEPISSAFKRVALPAGVSFFTFESMSYVIDVYRKELDARDSYLEYLSFVAFFPHLVAGPIVRPKDLLPQLSNEAVFDDRRASEGLFLIALGLVKKVAISDYLALNLVDRIFDNPAQYSSVEVYTAVVGYSMQIYCDFSGYTDIAIGSALMLGIRFPENFNSPYKSLSIQDFWRRWHISLSTWLKDYLYVPLGGSRKGEGRTYLNLMITMLLGGLWHGASWNFLWWGGLHGLGLAFHRWWSRGPGSKIKFPPILAWLLSFHFVAFCWIFFRAASFAKTQGILLQLRQLTTAHGNLPLRLLLILSIAILGHFMPQTWFTRLKNSFLDAPWWAKTLLLVAVLWLLREVASLKAVPFVYFEF